MASRVLSRFLPGLDGEHDDPGPSESMFNQDIVESGHMDRFQDHLDDHELDNMLLDAAPESPEETPIQTRTPPFDRPVRGSRPLSADRLTPLTPLHPTPDHDHDVPESLLMEAAKADKDMGSPHQHGEPEHSQRTQARPPTHSRTALRHTGQPTSHIPSPQGPRQQHISTPNIDPREQAMWRWTNVTNVDGFLLQVYEYYIDHGIWSICLARTIRILTTTFLFASYIFLSSCIDYSKVPTSKSTSEIIVKQCMTKTPFIKDLMLWLFSFWIMSTVFRYTADIRRLWHLHQFYHYLLHIPDSDLQTIPWERVVQGLMDLRDSNPATADNLPSFLRSATPSGQSKQRMDAHDIANRLMRRDNYYIAMIDKQIIDFTLPLPILGTRPFYSKSLEWCIGFCFENFIFDEHGHVKQSVLDIRNRQRMIYALRKRLQFAAVISVLMAPFNIGAHCIYFLARYYAEFRNSPAQLGARAFTPMAEWKMRHFDELDHELRHRLKMAYPFADGYLNQFPKDKTDQILQFVGLVTGTIAAVLGIATLLDPELFLGFEVTPGRTAFFYLSISMGIFAATRNAAAADEEVHDPVTHLKQVIFFTRHAPRHWNDQLHSNAVRAEFAELYQTKIVIFAQELLSLVVAPFILWRNSGKQSAHIIDFFRQFTVHVDGLGGLCNYAVFDFRKKTAMPSLDTAATAVPATTRAVDTNTGSSPKDDKMAMSQYYFMQRLGQYDQQQATSRYQRHMPLTLPPTFPPMTALTPLDEGSTVLPPPHSTLAVPKPDTLGSRPTSGSSTGSGYGIAAATATATAAATAAMGSSPHQSLLLDLHQKRSLGRGGGGGGGGGGGRRYMRRYHDAQDTLILPGGGNDDMHDLTTSRLIEQDVDLADSWKLGHDDPGRRRPGSGNQNPDDAGRRPRTGEGQGAGSTSASVKRGTGVFGLLVEYSRAHTDGKGPGRAGGLGS